MIQRKLEKKHDGSKYPLTPKLHRAVNALIKSDCANYYEGNCLVLDGLEPVECPQKQNYELCCTYFQNTVLPLDEALEAEIFQDNSVKYCEVCGAPFVPKSNRMKYCPECASEVHRKQKTEHERKRRKNVDI